MDAAQHQRPDIRGQLTLVGDGVGPVDISIIESRSEGIVINFWEAIVNRGKRGSTRLGWES